MQNILKEKTCKMKEKLNQGNYAKCRDSMMRVSYT